MNKLEKRRKCTKGKLIFNEKNCEKVMAFNFAPLSIKNTLYICSVTTTLHINIG